jgi:aldehyde:ferredoxin oxidoreductase
MNGRAGLGTVMGSKKLKAVAVRGERRVPLADEAKFKVLAGQTRDYLKEDLSTMVLNATGSAGNLDYFSLLGFTPARYFTQGEFPEGSALSGAVMAETILTGTYACYGCPVACGRKIEIPTGKYKTPETAGPEYETVCALGTILLIHDLEAVSHMGHLCDSAGLDTIGMGMTIGLATYLYERGIISSDDTGGIELRWGDPDLAIRLIEMTIRREGFGALLAQGSLRLARHFDAEELAIQVNGQSVAMHDPRAVPAMGLVYATSPRGACHNQSDMYWVELGRPIEELGIPVTGRFEVEGKAAITARHQDWRSLGNALILCAFPYPPVQNVLGLLEAATGWELDGERALWLGEGMWNIKRALNLRLGWNRADEKLPKLLMQPLAEGGSEGNVPDMETLLGEYYQHRGWDPLTGKPEAERLIALDMEDIAADLYD